MVLIHCLLLLVIIVVVTGTQRMLQVVLNLTLSLFFFFLFRWQIPCKNFTVKQGSGKIDVCVCSLYTLLTCVCILLCTGKRKLPTSTKPKSGAPPSQSRGKPHQPQTGGYTTSDSSSKVNQPLAATSSQQTHSYKKDHQQQGIRSGVQAQAQRQPTTGVWDGSSLKGGREDTKKNLDQRGVQQPVATKQGLVSDAQTTSTSHSPTALMIPPSQPPSRKTKSDVKTQQMTRVRERDSDLCFKLLFVFHLSVCDTFLYKFGILQKFE